MLKNKPQSSKWLLSKVGPQRLSCHGSYSSEKMNIK